MTGWIPCHLRCFLNSIFCYHHIPLSERILPHLVLEGIRVAVAIDQLVAVAKTVHLLVHLPKCVVQAILLCVRQVNIGNGLFRDICLK